MNVEVLQAPGASENSEEFPRRENPDLLVSRQSQEVLIAADDVFGVPFHGALKVSVI
jgi:hypothetical protein